MSSIGAFAAAGACESSPSGRAQEGDPSPASANVRDAGAALRLASLRRSYAALGADETPPNVAFEQKGEGVELTGVDGIEARLPLSAEQAIHLRDTASTVAVDVAIEGAGEVPAHVDGAFAVYSGAVALSDKPASDARADLVRKLTIDGGAEDFIAFDARPSREELRLRITPENAAGVRVANGVVEILDEQGVPRVRMNPPSYFDAQGKHAAKFDVQGCTVDRGTAPSWGRPFQHLEPSEKSCEVVVSFEGASYPMLLDPEWTDTNHMVTGRSNHSATLLSDFTVLLVGGFDPGGAPLNSAEIGCPIDVCSTAVYTPTNGSLLQARGDHTEAILPSGAVLLAGGRTSLGATTGLATAEVCTLPDFTCSSVAMSVGRLHQTSTTLNNGKVLIAGGDDTSPSTAQVFDGTSFGPALAMTAKRIGHVAELLPATGQVFIAGGVGSLGAVSTAEFFDANMNVFTPITGVGSQMTNPRAFATATRLEDNAGTILIAGGTNNVGVFYKTADIFVPNGSGGGSFQQQPVFMKVNRAFHRATRLQGTGKVLLTGGFDGTNVLANTEVFDQTTTTFTLDSTMNFPRAFHTATQLHSGQALVTGGGYKPTTGTFTPGSPSSTETLRRSNGEQCSVAGECASNFCTGPTGNKVCCDQDCGNICNSCRADSIEPSDGVCHQVKDGDPVKPTCKDDIAVQLVCIGGQVEAGSAKSCGAYTCDATTDKCAIGLCSTHPEKCSATGYCAAGGCLPKEENGGLCTKAEQCLSNFCADGVCCNSKCDGQCEACDGDVPGLCAQVTGKVRTQTLASPHVATGRDDCFGVGDPDGCEGTCGASRTHCDYPAKQCGALTCTNSMSSIGSCTDMGTCSYKVDTCGDFTCDADAKNCLKTCTSTAECQPGHICKADGSCALVEHQICADTHTAVTPEGTTKDCDKYLCRDNACLTSCASIDDCLSPAICDGHGKCIDPPANPAPPTGCSMDPSGSDGVGTTLFGGALALTMVGAVARRRRVKSSRGVRGAS